MGSGRTSRAEVSVAVAVFVTAVGVIVPAQAGWDVYALRFVALQLSLVAWVVAAALGGLRRPERSDAPLIAAAAGFALIAVVATALADTPAELLTFGAGYYMGAASWVAFAVVFVLATLARPHAALRVAMELVQAPLALIALVALVGIASGSTALAGFDNSNHIAPGLLLGGALALGLARGATGPRRWASLATAATCWLALALSGSAAGLGGLLVTIALAVFLAPALLGARTQTRARWARALAVASLGIALVVAGLSGELGDSLQSRLTFWRWSAEVGTASVFGTGADGFERAAQHLVAPDDSAVLRQGAVELAPVAGDPHSVPLLVLASFGVLGLLALGALAVAWVRAASGLLASGHGRSQRAAWIAGVAGSAAAMCLLPLSVQWAAVPAMLTGLVLVREPTERPAPSGALRAGIVAGGAALTAAALALTASTLVGAYWYAAAERSADAQTSVAAMERALAAQPMMTFYRFVVIDGRGKLAGPDPGDIAAFQAEVSGAGPAITDEPRYMALLVRTSLDHAYLTGRTDLAWEREALGRLNAEAPGWLEVPVESAHLALLEGDAPTAERLLTSVLPYATHIKRFGLYRYYYARAIGRDDLAAQALQTAVVDEETENLVREPPVPRW